MKKLLKKAMVFTLTAAMLVGTPLTASAAPLNSVFSISDGAGNVSGNTLTPTQTVTNTDTETSSSSSVLEKNEGEILGITLDQSYVTVVADKNIPKEKRQKITATVVLDSFDDPVKEKEVREALNKKIKWEVFHYDGSKGKKGAYVPSEILAIEADASDRSVVTLNPQHANNMKAGEEMIVRASIDGRYYWQITGKDEDGKIIGIKKELGGKEHVYQADAKVFVKEYSNDLWFDWNLDGTKDSTDTYAGNKGVAPTAYFKHTLDLSKYLARDPKTANDTITWTSTETKSATVTAAGVVTFKKKSAGGSIIAVNEKGKKVEWKFDVEEGQAASKIEIFEVGADGTETALATASPKNLVTLDVGKSDLLSKNFSVKMYAKVEAIVATDKVDGKDVPATDANKLRTNGTKYVTKKFDIEDGVTYYVPKDTKNKLISSGYDTKPVNITDVLTWTSNKTAFAVVTNAKGKTASQKASATVEARGLGKAAITVKATNGKNAKFTADVKATMGSLKIEGVKSPTYSGQSVQLTAKKLAISNNNVEIQNKDAVKWYIAKGGSGDDKVEEIKGNTAANKALLKNVKINNKGVLTISNKLDITHLDDIYVGLRTAKNKSKLGGTGEEPYYAEPVKVVLKQSSIDSIYVQDKDVTIACVKTNYKSNGSASFSKNKSTDGLSTKDAITKSTTISIPKGKTYTVVATPSESMQDVEAASTLNWKTSNAKVVDLATDGKTIKITAKAKGNATITVSGVNVDKSTKKNAKVINTNFKITVEQPATSLTLKKTQIVMKPKNKASVSVAAVLNPKGFRKTNVTWQYKQVSGDNVDTDWQPVKKNGKDVTAANASVTLGNVSAGDVFEIKASIPSGYSAKCRVEVVKDTKKLALVSEYTTGENNKITVSDTQWVTGQKNNKGQKQIGLEESITMKPLIDLGTNQAPDYYVPGTSETENTIIYTVNKKNIVNIVENDDGTVTVYPAGYGKVTITAKTALGKSAKVTVEVKRPSPTVSGNSK